MSETTPEQTALSLDVRDDRKVETVEGFKFEPIRGQPMLRWAGKRPFASTQYFPAQERADYAKDVLMRQTRSTDGGTTWEPIAPTTLSGLPPHLLVLKDGRLLAVSRRREGAFALTRRPCRRNGILLAFAPRSC